MRAAVEAVEGGVGVLINNAGYSQSGALETLPMDSVRRQFETNVFGAAADVPARAARDARGGRGQDRQRLLDGRAADVPGRRRLPRDQVRGRGDERRAADGGRALRHRRHLRRAGPDPDRVRLDRGGRRGADDGPVRGVQRAVAKSTREVYEGPLSRLGGDADDVAGAIESALGKRRAPTRVPVTPSARLIMGLRRVLPDRAWDRDRRLSVSIARPRRRSASAASL